MAPGDGEVILGSLIGAGLGPRWPSADGPAGRRQPTVAHAARQRADRLCPVIMRALRVAA
jgi:hypothetical protein